MSPNRMSAESSVLLTRNFSKMFLRARWALEFLHDQEPFRTSPSLFQKTYVSRYSAFPEPEADMRRREFIGLLSSTVASWPLAAHAQQSASPVIGFLSSRTPKDSEKVHAAFLNGLSDHGYVQGKNIAIEYRWAEGSYEALPKLAADLVQKKVRAIFAAGGDPSALAAKSATTTIPIVFTSGSDPIKSGLVSSLNRPGGNITGVSFLVAELGAKRLELLRELLPQSKSISFLINPQNPSSRSEALDLRIAASKTGRDVDVIFANDRIALEKAFVELANQKIDAVLVGNDPYFNSQREYLVKLAAQYSIPTFYYAQEFVTAGGLISYGASIPDAYRQAGHQIARILKGAKPSELPVMQPIKFEIALNLKAAKALGLEVPLFLQQRADDVIE